MAISLGKDNARKGGPAGVRREAPNNPSTPAKVLRFVMAGF